MGNIRRQSITSIIITYIGFFVGLANTYFFVKNGTFTPAQYGLTRIFFDVAQMFSCIAGLAIPSLIFKFHPYYKDNLPPKQNDLFTLTLIITCIGFVLLCVAGYIFEPLVIRKFGRSPLFIQYYYWLFPFAFGLLFFMLFEAFSWSQSKTVFPIFLRETVLRILTTGLIVYYLFQSDFNIFIKLFSSLYVVLAITQLLYIIRTKEIHFTWKRSRVTKKFKKKLFAFSSYIYVGSIIAIIAQSIDGIMISSLMGLASTGVFTLALYVSSLIQVPQRSVQAATIPVLSKAWKDKNYKEINRLYHRSSINLLLLSLLIFGCIWLNIHQAFEVFNIQKEYAQSLYVVLILGISRIIDAGTGVNGQIIITSSFWRFEFISGVLLLGINIPLNYFLIKQYGINGSAISTLISFTVYNTIRYVFLWKKCKMQPFTIKTLYAILLAIVAYGICFATLRTVPGMLGIVVRSLVFIGLMVVGVFGLQITPDAHQLLHVLKNRWKK